MIRRLSKRDERELLQFLKKNWLSNLLIINDIENYGFHTEFQEVWGDFNHHGQLNGGLLRYYRNFIPFVSESTNIAELADLIFQHDVAYEMISGVPEAVERFKQYLPYRHETSMHYAYLTSEFYTRKDPKCHDCIVRMASVDDVDKIVALYKNIEGFVVDSARIEELRHKLKTGTGKTYVVEKEGQIIASASTGAESTSSAMIFGVCTHPDYRRRGYAELCLSKLCDDLLGSGKTLCLFYNNPVAGAIYRKAGFREIGQWKMLHN